MKQTHKIQTSIVNRPSKTRNKQAQTKEKIIRKQISKQTNKQTSHQFVVQIQHNNSMALFTKRLFIKPDFKIVMISQLCKILANFCFVGGCSLEILHVFNLKNATDG